jgi:PilZ domain
VRPLNVKSSGTASSTALRNSKRIRVAFPIRLSFTEAKDGLSFVLTCTYDISETGARIGCQVPLSIGETVIVERKNRKAKYQVVWVGSAGDDAPALAGIEAISGNEPLWDEETRVLLEQRRRQVTASA